MALYDYMKQVTRLINDPKEENIDPSDLIAYINIARRQVAMQAQCVRVVPPITGSIASASITAGGAAYSATPTVTLSAPDFPDSTSDTNPNGLQATAAATVVGGAITSISISNPGSGYFQPTITITDSTGSGAAATPITTPLNVLLLGQEVYSFADMPLGNFPGVGSILAIKSVSIIFSNLRYSLCYYPFTTYQALIRQYPFQYKYTPSFFSQFGQGAGGSLYVYAPPMQTLQMEIDCICLPSDLMTDTDPEVIPLPWTDAVPYFAAFQCYMQMQNLNAASFYEKQYMAFLNMHSVAARPGIQNNIYGRF